MDYRWEAQQLGTYVRDARTARELSLRGLAALARVHFSWIAQLERGKIESPDPRNLAQVAWALGLSIGDLFMEAGYPAAPALPSVRPYLRAKYHLPDEAAAEVERHINEIKARLALQRREEAT